MARESNGYVQTIQSLGSMEMYLFICTMFLPCNVIHMNISFHANTQ